LELNKKLSSTVQTKHVKYTRNETIIDFIIGPVSFLHTIETSYTVQGMFKQTTSTFVSQFTQMINLYDRI